MFWFQIITIEIQSQRKSVIKFFGESRSMLKQTKSIAYTRTNAVTRVTLAYMTPELLPGDMLLQSASLCDYKMAGIWSLRMTLFCMLHPNLGSPFLIELSETDFDVHRNIGESLSEIILKKTKIFYQIPKHLNKSLAEYVVCNVWKSMSENQSL